MTVAIVIRDAAMHEIPPLEALQLRASARRAFDEERSTIPE